MNREDLERLLVELGGDLAFPPTPPLVAQVVERIAARSPVIGRPRLLRIAAVAAAVAIALAVGLPGPRRALADLFGIGGVGIAVLPELPPTPTVAEFTGEPVSLDAARVAVDFTVVLPTGYASPDAVYFDATVPGGLLTLAYKPGPGTYGMVITEMLGDVDQTVVEKVLGSGTRVTQVTVGDDPGLWIEGQPHVVSLLDADGAPRQDRTRLVGNTLLFVREGVTVRIETALDLSAALAIAAALAPAP